jgi:hypothetical protein
LLSAYIAGAFYWTQSLLVLPLGLMLLSGEGMYSYVYERRLLIIRLFAKSSEFINPMTTDDLYERDERWREFPRRKKLNALKGLVHDKSVYTMIVLSWVSVNGLLGGLVLLTAYKHFSWLKLITTTVRKPPQVSKD